MCIYLPTKFNKHEIKITKHTLITFVIETVSDFMTNDNADASII